MLFLYRVISNFLMKPTKSVDFNCRKDFNMRSTSSKRNTLSLFVSAARLSFVGSGYGSRMSENGGDGRREGFLVA